MTRRTAVPTSTYRLHLTHAFTLHDAAALVPHLHALGVDWVYASPIQEVPAGATHGYHVVDPDRVNPELGGEEGLAALRAAADAHDMGLVLDIVPNHMAASPDNPWWADLLARGPASPHARTFDVDFDAGPLVLPVLGTSVEQAIADGDLRVEDGMLVHHELRLPLAPDTDIDAPVEQVLAQQHYALHEWQHGEQILNWRRFFAVNELAGLRVEEPQVFDAVHATILRWVDEGTVDGLRIDHIDGLRDPAGYLETLRDRIGEDRWLVVEKIVESGELLPPGWPVDGTTGYEVNAALQSWLTDPSGHQALRRAFAQQTGVPLGTRARLARSKLAAMDELFVAEVDRIVALLLPVSGGRSEAMLRRGVRYLTAHLHGYRTYVGPEGEPSESDRSAIGAAARAADEAGAPEAVPVAGLLLGDEGRPALLRWQQLTGPAAAKGFEDRLLFRDVALSGLCEVGADAALLDAVWSPDTVTDFLTTRAVRSPLAGTTTSTHDTKRSEDVRARLTALAEVPDAFVDLFEAVSVGSAADAVDGHARWLLLQTVLATRDLEPGEDPAAHRERLVDSTRKALREAALHTTHRDPNEPYEDAVFAWLDTLLADGPASTQIDGLVERIAVPAACTSLAQVLLKIAAPGVPDVYRGCETWDGSLTDPDNRRPLDVGRLEKLRDRAETLDAEELRDTWQDGAVKALVTQRALRARRDLSAVFLSTRCETPRVDGAAADHVAALRRTASTDGPLGVPEPGTLPSVVALATRLPLALADGGWPIGEVWDDTVVHVGDVGRVTDVLTDRSLPVVDGRVRLSDAFAILPVALLECM